jgi:hypothetical protein
MTKDNGSGRHDRGQEDATKAALVDRPTTLFKTICLGAQVTGRRRAGVRF